MFDLNYKLFKSSDVRNVQGFRASSISGDGGVHRYSHGDRFIPRRSGLNLESAHYRVTAPSDQFDWWDTTQNNTPYRSQDLFEQASAHIAAFSADLSVDIDNEASNTDPSRWRRHQYVRTLQRVYDLPESNSRILPFTSPNKQNYWNHRGGSRKKVIPVHSDWPVYARSKPLIGTPESILDLPDFRSNIYLNLMEWGKAGYLAAAFRQEVYVWHSTLDETVPFADVGPHCGTVVSWNSVGDKLLIGTNNGQLSVMDIEHATKPPTRTMCPCVDFLKTCVVSSAVWSPHDKYIVSGCSRGGLTIFSSSLESIRRRFPAHGTNCSVITLRFSPDAQYLASSGSEGSVRLWSWPLLTAHLEITYNNPVRALAFHPWCGSKLAIGGGIGEGTLTIWNIANFKQVGYYKPVAPSFLDYLAWSDLTGELVASYWVHGLGYLDRQSAAASVNGHAEVLVLGALNKVADTLYGHQGRVLYMMWGPDSTKIATGGADENLCIWNFLGYSSSLLKHHKSRFVARKKNADAVYLSEINSLNNFGKYIR